MTFHFQPYHIMYEFPFDDCSSTTMNKIQHFDSISLQKRKPYSHQNRNQSDFFGSKQHFAMWNPMTDSEQKYHNDNKNSQIYFHFL